jgi:hypothetical protein
MNLFNSRLISISSRCNLTEPFFSLEPYRATPSSRSLRAVPDRLSRAAEARQARSGGDSDGDDP